MHWLSPSLLYGLLAEWLGAETGGDPRSISRFTAFLGTAQPLRAEAALKGCAGAASPHSKVGHGRTLSLALSVGDCLVPPCATVQHTCALG